MQEDVDDDNDDISIARSTCPLPGPCRPRIKCLVQTRPGSNRTVSPKSQRCPALYTKDCLGLHHQTRTFQTRHHLSAWTVVWPPICPDSLDNTLAFDVEFSQGFVVAVAAVWPPICPDSFVNTFAFDVAPTPDSVITIAAV